MPKNIYVHCEKCGYDEDITWMEDYVYTGIDKDFAYPIINTAWCLSCKKYVKAQEGVDPKKLESEVNQKCKQLGKLKDKWLKFENTRKEIKHLESDLYKYKYLIALLNGKISYTSCNDCGSVNVAFKDVENNVWTCPKCKIGILKKREEEDDTFFVYGTKDILPVTNKSDSSDMYQVFMCALEMIHNEAGYWVSMNKTAAFMENDSSKMAILCRCAYIFAILTNTKRWNVCPKDTANILYEMCAGLYDNIGLNRFSIIFQSHLKFFEDELYIAQNTNIFLPGKITYLLDNPTIETPSRSLAIEFDRNLKRSCVVFGIVNKVFDAYFKKYVI